MKIRLFGLLHLKEDEHSAENFYVNNFREQIVVYVNNAINLANSLRQRAVEFVLLTNNKSVIDGIVRSEGQELQVIEIPFSTKVPSGARFFSAHFKMDVFRYLATLNDRYVGVCDLDMACINDFSVGFLENIENQIPIFYDISDQVIPAYGQEVVNRDLGLIHHLKSEGKWAGGEFIGGTPAFFGILTTEINKIYNNYLNAIGELHHIGDEVVVSSALEVMRRNGTHMVDAGALGVVGRYWNAKTGHLQKQFEYFEKCSLLHLPADKIFLAGMARMRWSGLADFKKEYMEYRRPKTILERIMKRLLRVGLLK